MKAAYLGLEICIANPVENKYVSSGSNIFCSLIFVLMSKAAEPVVSNFGKAILQESEKVARLEADFAWALYGRSTDNPDPDS